MLTNKLLKKVVAVLDSDYSSYAIAKAIGDASAHHINNLRNGKSKIADISFAKLEKLERFYEETVKANAGEDSALPIRFFLDTPTGFVNDRTLYATNSTKAIVELENRETTVEVTESEARHMLYNGGKYAPIPQIEYSDTVNLNDDWETYVVQMLEDAKYRFK